MRRNRSHRTLHDTPQPARPPRGEEGYSLAALLAVLAVLMIVMTGAAPNLRQQAQREKETEAIYRGEQVARAIQLYARANRGALPTKIEQLQEGVSRGPKRYHIMRASAARDPLSADGKWQLIAPNANALLEFQQALMLYANGTQPRTTDPVLQRYAVQLSNLVNLGQQKSASPFSTTSPLSGGPFIGVASGNKNRAVMHYYGIEEHDRWVFTPLFK